MTILAGEVSVFADTNLGTRVGLNVPQDITAGAFKTMSSFVKALRRPYCFAPTETGNYWYSEREFERVHFLCLPNSGKIQVNGLMVKRKLCFYYLPDSLPLKYLFHGMRSTWFLHVEASHSKNFHISHSPESAPTTRFEAQDLINCNADDKARGNGEDNTVHILEKKKRKRKFNKKHLQNAASAMPEEERPVVMPGNEVRMSVKPNANLMQGSLGEMSTEVLSVTGIIGKYFATGNRMDNFSSPSLSDVTSRAVCQEVDNQPKSTFETPPNVLRAPLRVDSVSITSQNERRESKLRKRLDSGTSQDQRRESKLRKRRVSETSQDQRRESKLRKCRVSGTSQDQRRESKLRKRLLAASLSLGISPNKQSPTLSLCRFKDVKLSLDKSQTIGSLFNISDDDDD